MSGDAREFSKFDKEMEDLEVADMPESNTDDKKYLSNIYGQHYQYIVDTWWCSGL